MNVQFAKMHGLGNDFMVVDLVSQALTLDPAQIRCWSDRHTGVGFDQLLVRLQVIWQHQLCSLLQNLVL